MPILPFKTDHPEIHESAFIAPDAWVTGKVTIAANVSIFFGACLRGDIQRLIVGEGSNIQEQSVIHSSKGRKDCIIGSRVTVGHGAILHGCEVKGRAIIGMGAIVLDDAVVGERCIIGANSLIPIGMQIPEGSLVYGSPAKVIRSLTEKEIYQIDDSAARYIEVGLEYQRVLKDK